MSHAASLGLEIPYLPKQRIEAEARLVLAEYAAKWEPVLRPPVPVDEIAELLLGLTLEFHDMKSLFPVADVHGAIWFRDARIGIDQGLDPYVQPARRGRYHFTLSHEIGHWRLHRKHFLKHRGDRILFGGVEAPPDVMCRLGKRKPPVEWQADYFASCLLMPRAMVVSEWTEFRDGNDQPMTIQELRDREAQVPRVEPFYYQGKPATDQAAIDKAIKEEFCSPLAQRFAVSAEAMRIRLEHLGLFVETWSKTLF